MNFDLFRVFEFCELASLYPIDNSFDLAFLASLFDELSATVYETSSICWYLAPETFNRFNSALRCFSSDNCFIVQSLARITSDSIRHQLPRLVSRIFNPTSKVNQVIELKKHDPFWKQHNAPGGNYSSEKRKEF